MKTLAQYLAEYIDQELGHSIVIGQEWIKILQEGIEAYQSTENCTITITVNRPQDLLDAAKEIISDFNRYGEVLQVGDNGEYGMDSAIGRLNSAVVEYDGD